jgi:hypothetical protein
VKRRGIRGYERDEGRGASSMLLKRWSGDLGVGDEDRRADIEAIEGD